MKQKLSKYIASHFVPGSEPTRRTVMASIMRGDLPGRLVRVGADWYVETEAAHPVAQDIIRSVASCR